MKFTSPMRQLAALALTAVFLTTAALSGFAVYAMPIQAAYPQESIYLFDADTGETLVEQNPDLPRCVASLTKMMTALLVLESGTDLNASITIPDSLTPELQSIRANRGHTIGLQAGETVRRIDMMYAMLLPSANDAASVLANDTSGSLAAFAAQMNVRASQLGCTATHFTCPHGLYDGGNYSTAREHGQDRAGLLRKLHLPADRGYGVLSAAGHGAASGPDDHDDQQAPAARQRLLPQLCPRHEDRFYHAGRAVLRHLRPAGRPHLRAGHPRLELPEHLPGGGRAV